MRRSAARARMLGLAVLITALALPAFAAPALADVANAPQRTWSTNGRVASILPFGGLVYVAGTFTQVIDTAGHATSVSNIAVFNPANGTFSTAWQGKANGEVNALAVSGTTLYIGGAFSTADGVSRKRLAAVTLATGSLVSGWSPGVVGLVDQLAVVGTNVYAVGTFTSVTDSHGTLDQPYVVRFDATSGVADRTWIPQADAVVHAVIGSADGSHIFIGGEFDSVSGVTSDVRTASIFTATGLVDPTFRPGNNNNRTRSPVIDLATDGTRLIEAVAGGGGACTAQDATRGTTLWSVHSNGDVQAVAIFGSDVFCGGHFDSDGAFGGLYRKKLAEVDLVTGAIQDFDPVVNSALGVWALASDATHLFVGGDFTKISGVNQAHFAMYTDQGSQTAPLSPLNLDPEAGNNAVFLSWDAPSSDGGAPVTAYQVYRAVGSGTLAKLGSTTASAMKYTDATATNGTTYTYAVAATNSIGTGSQSAPVSVTPLKVTTTVAGAPTGLTGASGAGAVELTWTAPVDDGHSPVTGYQILRGTKAGTETPLATTGATPSYADSTATLGTTYFYTVKAINHVGTGAASNETSAAAAAGVPAAPTLVGTAGTHSITLTWNTPSNGGAPITKYTLVKDGVRLTNPGAGANSFVDNVPTGETHTYQINAVNSVGTSKFSNTVTVTAK